MSTTQNVRIEQLETATSAHHLELYGSPGETEKGLVMIVNNHTKQLEKILRIHYLIYKTAIVIVVGAVVTTIIKGFNLMT